MFNEILNTFKAMQTKLTVYCHRPPASEFLIVTLKSEFRIQQNLCFVSNKLCCVSKKILARLKILLVSMSGNRPGQWMQVTALIPFWMLESMRLYKKCDTEVIATSHHKFDNAITTKNNNE